MYLNWGWALPGVSKSTGRAVRFQANSSPTSRSPPGIVTVAPADTTEIVALARFTLAALVAMVAVTCTTYTPPTVRLASVATAGLPAGHRYVRLAEARCNNKTRSGECEGTEPQRSFLLTDREVGHTVFVQVACQK